MSGFVDHFKNEFDVGKIGRQWASQEHRLRVSIARSCKTIDAMLVMELVDGTLLETELL